MAPELTVKDFLSPLIAWSISVRCRDNHWTRVYFRSLVAGPFGRNEKAPSREALLERPIKRFFTHPCEAGWATGGETCNRNRLYPIPLWDPTVRASFLFGGEEMAWEAARDVPLMP